MDRVVAMLILLGVLVSLVLIILALFAVAPVVCSCLLSLVYTLYLFMAYEESGVHHAQEFENRFWTIFALLFSTALFFAQDSPVAFGRYSPSLGFFGVVLSSYAMHLWDRYVHRVNISRQTKLRRSVSMTHRLNDLDVEEQLAKINGCLRDIDQLLIPSTINNFINQRFVLRKEREIISIFSECDAVALNSLISHVKLGLLIYKIKDHRNFSGQHRTELIQILAFDRLPALTTMSRVILLHSLQVLKLRANPRAEYWVRNVILNTHQDDLSEIKTLTDAKGDYFCMNKLIFDDIRSETVRQDILSHIRREGALQVAHMQMGTKRAQRRQHMAWRKVLSDVDDTLYCSGGSYPAGIDKRFAKKVVYPGVLAFYRELDLGTRGPEEWPDNLVGNLVFLSARPHVYKDMSEKSNFAKFEKLRKIGDDGRATGMHTIPSLLAGDIASGTQFIATNDFGPLSRKKLDNFRRYVSIYPEYQHVFVCDNGQGDVRAGEMMFDNFPYEFEALYVHVVQSIPKTYGYAPDRWRQKEFKPCFFRTYPEAALDAASRVTPLIRITGLQRVCHDAVKDFDLIPSKQWQSPRQKTERRAELNQAIWRANNFLIANKVEPVRLIQAERLWQNGEKVKTPYGRGIVKGFDPEVDLYDIELDWRPLDVQINDHLLNVKEEAIRPRANNNHPTTVDRRASLPLETVMEADEITDDEPDDLLVRKAGRPRKLSSRLDPTATLVAEVPRTVNAVKRSYSTGDKRSESELKQSPSDNLSQTDSSSISSDDIPSDVTIKDGANFRPFARISGKLISKYMPPHLPKLPSKKTSPLFTFWNASPPVPPVFREGDKCSTPYGVATVIEHRQAQGVVVVDMIGWKARGYLKEVDVKVVSQGILATLFRRQASVVEVAPKQLDFPYAHGTVIRTPYGEAIVAQPLPLPTRKDGSRADATKKLTADVAKRTICLSLTTWTLADESHPKLYCTVEIAQIWKDTKPGDAKSVPDGLLSAFGTLVSSTLDFAGRFSAAQQPKPKAQAVAPKFVQHYRDAAAVSTSFGDGMVRKFRENDGFYEISLIGWKLPNGACATAYFQRDAVSYRIAKGCQEGYPVLTSFGLTGKLESVEPTTGVHLVIVPSANIVMYLQPECVIRPLKAAVGEDVLSAYGEGTVEAYIRTEDTYRIKLKGWNAKLYAKAETFDRVGDTTRDRGGQSGMSWLVSFFFSSSNNNNSGSTRSRSNSVVSARSVTRSHSARSVS